MKELKYIPIGKNILVEAVKISSTVLVPNSVEPQEYLVVAAGSDANTFISGKKVILSTAAMIVPIPNTNYFVTSSDNVLCMVA